MEYSIRLESEKDINNIYKLNASCFETPAEAKLVNALRISAKPFLSIVAVLNDNNDDDEISKVVGHIAFSPVTITTGDGSDLKKVNPNQCFLGLAPVATDKSYRQKGIATALIKKGIEIAKEKYNCV
eukprot:Pgem_evm1s8842